MDNLIRVVVTAVIPYENGFLFVKTKKDNKYGLPGGKVNPFEDLRIAIPREVAEETGLEIVLKHIIGFYYNKSARGHPIFNTAYFGIIVEGKPEITEKNKIEEIRFFSLKEIRKLYRKGKLRNIGSLKAVEDHLQGKKYSLNTIDYFLEQ